MIGGLAHPFSSEIILPVAASNKAKQADLPAWELGSSDSQAL